MKKVHQFPGLEIFVVIPACCTLAGFVVSVVLGSKVNHFKRLSYGT